MLQYSIDHLVIREGQLFAYGWGFFPSNPILRLVLHVEFEGATSIDVDGEYGRQRDDVKAAFANIDEADNAGFLLLVGFSQQTIKSIDLRWECKDGNIISTPMTLPKEKYGDSYSASKLKLYNTLLSKAWILFRSSGIKALFRKGLHYISGRPRWGGDKEWDRLGLMLANKEVSIVVDHDMGGGANLYRHQYVAERQNKGNIVLLLSFHLATLQYFIEIFDEKGSQRLTIASPDVLLSVVANCKIEHIVYNCAVSLRKPFAIIDLLIALKQSSKSILLVTIHDFFSVCPSHFLLDNNGIYCGVPDQEQCNRCLTNHTDGFVSMTGIKDISHWRNQWARLLVAANEVRLFSASSKVLLKKAYPLLSDHTWRVVPHVLHTAVSKIETHLGACLHIGIVGAIGKHKGASIVNHLVAEIVRQNLSTKISIIGTLESKVSASFLTVTGAYSPENLSQLIEGTGANVFLFPSIWAETFSYVSHELVAMGVPFACFDFGAPADLARSYERGTVLTSMDASYILMELEALRQKSYR